ncbi:MAG TPA: DUF4115 domain-containing protein [Acidimicrobiales bacterium]|jgi:hypothetical protein|nr:DUF4115 domain-containing protein [Acidimicrobiales bacterium]
MTILVTFPLIFLLVVIVADRWRRRRRDDRSIELHRTALDVIEHVSGGEASGPPNVHVRVLPGEDPAPTRPIGSGDADGCIDGDVDLDRVILPSLPRPARRADRPHFPAVPSQVAPEPVVVHPAVTMNHDVAQIIAGRAGAAVAAGRRVPPSSTTTRRLRVTGEPARWAIAGGSVAAGLIVVAVVGLAAGAAGRGGTRHPSAVSSGRVTSAGAHPTTTVAPAPATPSVVVTRATSTDATYTVSAATLNVHVATSGTCWVEMRDGSASGPVVFEGTLASGVDRAFQTAGSLWLRLGDPARVKVTIDGATVALPAAADPFNLTVQRPAGA